MNIFPIPCGFDNYAYLLVCEHTGTAAVIDPTEAYPVMREVAARGLDLKAIYCTHHHHDHVGGIEDLLADMPGLAVYGYHEDAERIPALTHPLSDGDELVLGNVRGQVLHTPGHTVGSLCYQFADAIFTGDTMFGGGCGRLFEGTAEQMYLSLNHVIARLPGATRVYFGHEYTEQNLIFAQSVEPGNPAIAARLRRVRARKAQKQPTSPSMLLLELQTNPFLRCQEAEIMEQFRQNRLVVSTVDVFLSLRQQRDIF